MTATAMKKRMAKRRKDQERTTRVLSRQEKKLRTNKQARLRWRREE